MILPINGSEMKFWLRDRLRTRGRGTIDSFATLARRGQAVETISTQVGRFYAGRVENQRFRVWRDYFNKGSRNLRIAGRRSRVNDWDGAGEMWLKETNSHKRKAAGRACYNMAIYAEINGDLYGALEWAQKAYTDYRIGAAKDYARLLRRRIQRWENNQMRKELDEQDGN